MQHSKLRAEAALQQDIRAAVAIEIGDGECAAVIREIDENVRLSRNNTGMVLCLAINYGGRTELVDAVRAIVEQVRQGTLAPGDIDETTLSDALYTGGMPDPDLLIRTAGELRVSNFLLWQISYAELWVTDKCWPMTLVAAS